MVWNPQQYLKFSGHRLRPAVDLLMRIPDFPVRSVADLGAGAGNVTKLIKERWPDAKIIGVEGSAEMVAAGKKAAKQRLRRCQQASAALARRKQFDSLKNLGHADAGGEQLMDGLPVEPLTNDGLWRRRHKFRQHVRVDDDQGRPASRQDFRSESLIRPWTWLRAAAARSSQV